MSGSILIAASLASRTSSLKLPMPAKANTSRPEIRK
jgi:hypothetical protein